jgi:flagellar biosynthetic protein FliP
MTGRRMHRRVGILLLAVAAVLGAATVAHAVPQIHLDVDDSGDPSSLPLTLKIVLLLTVLSLAPALAVLMTSFTRIVVVLSFLKHAMGVQTTPPSQVLVGLALFLSAFVMAPVAKQVNETALQPLLAHEISDTEAWQRAAQPVRAFMLHQTRVKDLEMFASLAGVKNAPNVDAVPLYAVVPAFVVSELTTAFQIGFMLFIPFLVIDMVVASVLMSMGMMMLPPVMISMPFKILLFVLVDGWHLVVQSLVTSFN